MILLTNINQNCNSNYSLKHVLIDCVDVVHVCLHYLYLCVYCGVQHILCFCFVCLRLLYPVTGLPLWYPLTLFTTQRFTSSKILNQQIFPIFLLLEETDECGLHLNIVQLHVGIIISYEQYNVLMFYLQIGAALVVIVWQLHLQLSIQSVHITTEAVSSNPANGWRGVLDTTL